MDSWETDSPLHSEKTGGLKGSLQHWPTFKCSYHLPSLAKNLQLAPSTSCRASLARLSSPPPAARRVRAHFPSLCAPVGADDPFRCAGLQIAVRRAPARSSLPEILVSRVGAQS